MIIQEALRSSEETLLSNTFLEGPYWLCNRTFSWFCAQRSFLEDIYNARYWTWVAYMEAFILCNFFSPSLWFLTCTRLSIRPWGCLRNWKLCLGDKIVLRIKPGLLHAKHLSGFHNSIWKRTWVNLIDWSYQKIYFCDPDTK